LAVAASVSEAEAEDVALVVVFIETAVYDVIETASVIVIGAYLLAPHENCVMLPL